MKMDYKKEFKDPPELIHSLEGATFEEYKNTEKLLTEEKEGKKVFQLEPPLRDERTRVSTWPNGSNPNWGIPPLDSYKTAIADKELYEIILSQMNVVTNYHDVEIINENCSKLPSVFDIEDKPVDGKKFWDFIHEIEDMDFQDTAEDSLGVKALLTPRIEYTVCQDDTQYPSSVDVEEGEEALVKVPGFL